MNLGHLVVDANAEMYLTNLLDYVDHMQENRAKILYNRNSNQEE